jgi:hypothetical protein
MALPVASTKAVPGRDHVVIPASPLPRGAKRLAKLQT